MSRDSNKGYQFDLINGQVRAVYEIENGRVQREDIDDDEQWTVDGQVVQKSEYDDGRLEVTRYADADGDGVYQQLAATVTQPLAGTSLVSGGAGESSAREKYWFDLVNGQVAAAFELEHGVRQRQFLDVSERYLLDGTDVLKIEDERWGQEITRYSDVDGDGIYAKVSEQWVGRGDAAGVTPVIAAPLHYEGDGRDDYIGLTPDAASSGGAGADHFVFRQLAHVRVDDFRHGDGDKLVFDTGLGLISLAQLLGFVTAVRDDGHETVIEFGNSVSLSLVGIRADSLQAADFEILS